MGDAAYAEEEFGVGGFAGIVVFANRELEPARSNSGCGIGYSIGGVSNGNHAVNGVLRFESMSQAALAQATGPGPAASKTRRRPRGLEPP